MLTPSHLPWTSWKSPCPWSKAGGVPIYGNQRPPEVPLGPSCLLLVAWVTATPLCPHRDNSLSLGGGRHTPQLACTHCPTCLSHTAYTGHVGCRGSVAEGGTGTGDSWPAERGQTKGTARPSGHKRIAEEYESKGHAHRASTVAWVSIGCQKGTMRYLGSLRHRTSKWLALSHTALPVPLQTWISPLDSKRPLRGLLGECRECLRTLLFPMDPQGTELKAPPAPVGNEVAEMQGRLSSSHGKAATPSLGSASSSSLPNAGRRRHSWVETGWALLRFMGRSRETRVPPG